MNKNWIPAFAGMTSLGSRGEVGYTAWWGDLQRGVGYSVVWATAWCGLQRGVGYSVVMRLRGREVDCVARCGEVGYSVARWCTV